MANTAVGTGTDLAVTQYQQERIAEQALNFDALAQKGMVGEGSNNVIVVERDLEKGQGDVVNYYLEMKLVGAGKTEGETLRGSEEKLVYYMDSLKINEITHAVILDGKMTEQRTKVKLRKRAPRALGRWGGEWKNELAFTMLSGARGTNTGKLSSSFSGFAGNSLVVPDSNHQRYAGSANSKASLASTDKLSLTDWEKAVTAAETLTTQVMPLSIDGDDKFIGYVHSYQSRDMKANTNTAQWADIQKAVISGGGKNLFMKNALGEHSGVIFHRSQDVRTFSDYGAGANVAAARALLLGSQAGVIAYGKGYGDGQWDYVEITDDYERQTGFGTALIVGLKPCIFNSERFGMIAIDSAAAAA